MRLRWPLPAITATTAAGVAARAASASSPPSVLSSGLWLKTSTARLAGAGELRAQPVELLRTQEAARAAVAVDGVEHERAGVRAQVDGVVERPAAGGGAQRGRRGGALGQRGDELARPQEAPLGSGATVRERPGAPASSSARTAAALSVPGSARTSGSSPVTIRVAGGEGVELRGRRRLALDEQVVVAERGVPGRAQPGRAERRARRRRAAPDGAARRGRGGRRAGRPRRPPARPRSPGAPVSGSTSPPSSTASAWRSSAADAESSRSPVTNAASGRTPFAARTAAARTCVLSASCGRNVEPNGAPRRSRNGTRPGDSSSRTCRSVSCTTVASTSPGSPASAAVGERLARPALERAVAGRGRRASPRSVELPATAPPPSAPPQPASGEHSSEQAQQGGQRGRDPHHSSRSPRTIGSRAARRATSQVAAAASRSTAAATIAAWPAEGASGSAA